jgi:ribosomal-protein-alanine N-acetyltransferase
MATIALRPLVPDDIEAAGALEQSVYSQPWSTGVFADELAQPSRTYLAVEVDGDLVGYGGVMLVDDEAHITTVVVDPHRREQGLGTRLVMSLVQAARSGGARSLTLEVRASNKAAQALYRRFGMAPVGVRKRYYRDEDALIMWAHDIDGEDYAHRLEQLRRELP